MLIIMISLLAISHSKNIPLSCVNKLVCNTFNSSDITLSQQEFQEWNLCRLLLKLLKTNDKYITDNNENHLQYPAR